MYWLKSYSLITKQYFSGHTYIFVKNSYNQINQQRPGVWGEGEEGNKYLSFSMVCRNCAPPEVYNRWLVHSCSGQIIPWWPSEKMSCDCLVSSDGSWGVAIRAPKYKPVLDNLFRNYCGPLKQHMLFLTLNIGREMEARMLTPSILIDESHI